MKLNLKINKNKICAPGNKISERPKLTYLSEFQFLICKNSMLNLHTMQNYQEYSDII